MDRSFQEDRSLSIWLTAKICQDFELLNVASLSGPKEILLDHRLPHIFGLGVFEDLESGFTFNIGVPTQLDVVLDQFVVEDVRFGEG